MGKIHFHQNILCISKLLFLVPFDNCSRIVNNYFHLILVQVLILQFHKYVLFLEEESNCLGKMLHLDNRWQQMHNFLKNQDLLEDMDHQYLDTMKSHLCQAKLKINLQLQYVVIIIKCLIEKLEHTGWKLLVFERFKFYVFKKATI